MTHHRETTVEAANAVVTSRLFEAEVALNAAIVAWRALVAAEETVAGHPDATPVERQLATRNVFLARNTVTVLVALRGEKERG